jgi:quercetin dioxygenase-like cupin family protein
VRERAGAVFSIAAENPAVPGCTVSREIYGGPGGYAAHFSLAAGTDISPELYDYPKLLIPATGNPEVCMPGARQALAPGDALITPVGRSVGVRAGGDTVYTEIGLRRSCDMDNSISPGEVFRLGELVPYQANRIVNRDIIRSDRMKFVVMSFDAGTSLAEHAAPGEALLFALDGEGVIGYEGREHLIRAGENFKFDKNGRHFVRAERRFKMALLLTLE